MNNADRITSQRALRAAFWREHPQCSRKLIRNYAGNGTMYCTDTRTTFCDWLDAMSKSGRVSQDLAQRATLNG